MSVTRSSRSTIRAVASFSHTTARIYQHICFIRHRSVCVSTSCIILPSVVLLIPGFRLCHSSLHSLTSMSSIPTMHLFLQSLSFETCRRDIFPPISVDQLQGWKSTRDIRHFNLQFCIATADCDKRVVFGDLLLHLGCDLWFSFCTARDRPGTKTEP